MIDPQDLSAAGTRRTMTVALAAALVILLLGFGLVFLGAQWDRLRSALMRGLPEFPGKGRLPPYASKI